ncbi:MAG: DNA mismatch repair protein MutS, partial [Proteobacteria bacterium]
MSDSEKKLTPFMRQWQKAKTEYPDTLLLFRMGDFYELFGDDAKIVAKECEITLTARNKEKADAIPMCGVPYHSIERHIAVLLGRGYRVAVCEQMEDPKYARGIVKREVVRVLSPGTVLEDAYLSNIGAATANNYLAAIVTDAKITRFGLAFVDITTGEFFVAEGTQEYIDKLLQSLKPAEVIFQRSYQKHFKEQYGTTFYTYSLESWIFDSKYANEILLKHFQTHSLKGFGIEAMNDAIIAAGTILHYLKDTEHPNLQHITTIQRIDRNDHLWMDKFTIRNLELLGNGTEGNQCLLKVLDNTISPMGARLLKRWTIMPLNEEKRINERLNLTEFFIKDIDLRNKISMHLKQCGDVERLVSKIPMKKINPREVMQ